MNSTKFSVEDVFGNGTDNNITGEQIAKTK